MLRIILLILDLYGYVLIAYVILSWLTAYNILNTRTEFVRTITHYLHVATDPVLSRIRKVLPPFSGIDFSPLIAFVGIQIIVYILTSMF